MSDLGDLGQLEIIERAEEEDYLRLVVKDGLVVGGQAIGRLADYIWLFIGAMWRKDYIPALRENWPRIASKGSSQSWTYLKTGELIVLKS